MGAGKTIGAGIGALIALVSVGIVKKSLDEGLKVRREGKRLSVDEDISLFD